MEVKVEEREGYNVVKPMGELDVYTVPHFRKAMLRLEGDKKHHLIIDLGAVDYIDSTGLGSLIEIYQKVESAGGELAFVCDNPGILKILNLTNLNKVFRLFPNLGKAFQHASISGGYIDEEFFSDSD